MSKLNQVIIRDWAQRLAWALIGIIAYSFALAFTYNETEPVIASRNEMQARQSSAAIDCHTATAARNDKAKP